MLILSESFCEPSSGVWQAGHSDGLLQNLQQLGAGFSVGLLLALLVLCCAVGDAIVLVRDKWLHNCCTRSIADVVLSNVEHRDIEGVLLRENSKDALLNRCVSEV
jgi:hypothetical protein